MFDEIPPPRSESLPSYEMAFWIFGLYFALAIAYVMVAWFHWHTQHLMKRDLFVAEGITGGLLSGACLFGAKSASPESNRIRMGTVIAVFTVFQSVVSVLS